MKPTPELMRYPLATEPNKRKLRQTVLTLSTGKDAVKFDEGHPTVNLTLSLLFDLQGTRRIRSMESLLYKIF